MAIRPLLPLLLAGCAAGRGAASAPQTEAGSAGAAAAVDGVCERRSAVTVHVINQGSSDVEITFGSYRVSRASLGFSRTTYRVARTYLQDPIQLRIRGGGLEVGTPPPVQTEYVVCNDATLIIGPRPSYSFFYGDRVVVPRPDPKADTTGIDPAQS
jgi:hypothetical protein